MQCVYLALWTRKVLRGSFYAPYIFKKTLKKTLLFSSFFHSYYGHINIRIKNYQGSDRKDIYKYSWSHQTKPSGAKKYLAIF